ncbi:uroporphyrinogen-III C-methyltransferase [Pseudomonas aeruginosa]|uniref:uroporphyrinogen-III C-methyltransferase n=1 Tax=Pseudomonas aeruginosa TaxID=287 RepID=UPI0003A9BCA8|nr:uroporphyrinogen-III C-methyltransferase [Pseudomonas aeruginosa]KAA5800756.1 heme biosynthesis operon protein HemX [Pseudomonas aeruginosa]MBG4217687.1 uroporphyrinogen-III C-methyltransferase [Pseudomonas aeruginosa]MBG6551049.1 uroporphyrinogen-III C-methyltransferase [Pseudomonas aeruginosa]MBH3928913.1 uroporphyrinogen-III C-methyltransferase [Pseudomonas aeruginosa]MCO2536618.1 heme biosynthesis operon protein HemX [Pseudomonas aeruginosa]
MSEAVTPQDDARTSTSTPSPVAPDASRRSGTATGLALLALLVGVAGLGAGGWSFWQVQQLQGTERDQLAQLEDARGKTESLAQRNQQLAARLDALPTADELEARRRLVVELQGDQQHLSEQLKKVLGQSRQQWRLAEAEHLVRLASLRLSALQDVGSATELVQGADDILRAQNDPGAYAARAKLAASLEALRALPEPDRTGLFVQLAALREQVNQLQPLTPTFKEGESGASNVAWGDGNSTWELWWEKISRYIRIDFNAGQDIRPLLAGEQLAQVRLTIGLALEQAQWAALNGKQQVYEQALKQAQEVLDGYFNVELADSRALKLRIDELAKQPVTVQVPDLAPALSALQSYVSRREAAGNLVPEAQAAPATEGRP